MPLGLQRPKLDDATHEPFSLRAPLAHGRYRKRDGVPAHSATGGQVRAAFLGLPLPEKLRTIQARQGKGRVQDMDERRINRIRLI